MASIALRRPEQNRCRSIFDARKLFRLGVARFGKRRKLLVDEGSPIVLPSMAFAREASFHTSRDDVARLSILLELPCRRAISHPGDDHPCLQERAKCLDPIGAYRALGRNVEVTDPLHQPRLR